MGAADKSHRRRAINDFVHRHELAWDLIMAGLAGVFIVAGLFEDHPYGVLNGTTVTPIQAAITFLFAGEFALRFYAASSRIAYLKHHWVDLLALVPAIRFLRFLRLGRMVYLLQAARVLRLGVMIRFLVESDRVGSQVRWIAARHGIHVLLLSALGLVVLGGSMVWEVEDTANPSFRSLGDAIWWAFASMTTVGYGSGPLTLFGRVIGGLIMVVGIACFGLITATATTYFLEQREGHQVSPNELMIALEDIRQRISRLEEVTHAASSFDRQLAIQSLADGQRPGDHRLGQPGTDRPPS